MIPKLSQLRHSAVENDSKTSSSLHEVDVAIPILSGKKRIAHQVKHDIRSEKIEIGSDDQTSHAGEIIHEGGGKATKICSKDSVEKEEHVPKVFQTDSKCNSKELKVDLPVEMYLSDDDSEKSEEKQGKGHSEESEINPVDSQSVSEQVITDQSEKMEISKLDSQSETKLDDKTEKENNALVLIKPDKDQINGNEHQSDERRMTRAMSRQVSTGFTLKSPPVLSSENVSKKCKVLETIGENDVQDMDVKEESSSNDWKVEVSRGVVSGLDGKTEGKSMENEIKEEDDDDKLKGHLSVDKSHNQILDSIPGSEISESCDISEDVKEETKDLDLHGDTIPKFLSHSSAGNVPIYKPNITNSSLLKSTLSRSFSTSHSSDAILSPEIAELSARALKRVWSPSRSPYSSSPSSPVSPLPPSPFDLFLPIPISPLPPSPVRDTRPLSPLPGSPASSNDTASPVVPGFMAMIGTPSSGRSTDSTPVCTPVSFLTPLAPTPGRRDSGVTPPLTGEAKMSVPLCSFHNQAPSDAITVKPQNACDSAARCKRSLSPSFDAKRGAPDKQPKRLVRILCKSALGFINHMQINFTSW